MGTQAFRDTYRAAFHKANADLHEIYEEYHQLQLRKEQIETMLVALEPFLPDSEMQVGQDTHRSSRASTEPPSEEPLRRAPESARKAERSPAPVSPISDLDPIQRRINSALGLAVA